MIHVDRKRVRRPPSLLHRSVRAALQKAREFYELSAKARAQRTFDFDTSLFASDEVTKALIDLFRGKCAYCESPIGATGPPGIDHFRPRAGALDLAGSTSDEHYWWLAYEWDNLYLSCAECQSMKGTRFPTEGRRAKPTAHGLQLVSERALLLDPCVDNPEEDLVFLEDGTVASNTERGRVTIEVLGLNRSGLVEGRRVIIEDARLEWKILLPRLASRPAGDPRPADLEALFDDALPYAAVRRQFVKEWAFSDRAAVDDYLAATPEGPSSVEEVATETPVVDNATKRRVKASFDARQVAQESYSVAEETVGEGYFVRARMLERIEIHNFKVIEDLRLDFPPPTRPEHSAWLMLLGENGCGKSTVLQAVALALAGQDYRERLGLDASLYVRHQKRTASVKVHLVGNPEPITLTCRRGSPHFGGEPAEPKVLLLGYGATRLLPKPGSTTPPDASFARAANLFDPFVPLADVEPWLLGLDRATFDQVARALKSLLMLEEDDRLIPNRRDKRIDVEAFGTRVPLDQLSDGYQSVLALAADVMIVMTKHWGSMEAAEGIVLVDELGAHLHPRWRMRIVESLRAIFPRLQFLVSTHDPLCLRGLENGEVAVMRRDEEENIVALTDLPPLKGLRVDQLLTSEHFGLNSTIDPELDALFAEYYLLKAKARLNASEQHRHDELRDQLEELQVLGATRRERIVLEAADEFVAKEQVVVDETERHELKEETKRKIAEVWERVASGRQA